MGAWRYPFICLLLLFCLAGRGYCLDSPLSESFPVCTPGEACVDVPQKSFDFGKVNAHREIEHIFPVTNFGEAALEIKDVIVGWGVTAQFDRAIPPGGEGKIILTVKPDRCKGAVKKSAIVRTNDPKNNAFWLHLKWSL